MIPKDILYTHKSVPVQLSQEKLPLSLNGTDRDTEADIIQNRDLGTLSPQRMSPLNPSPSGLKKPYGREGRKSE